MREYFRNRQLYNILIEKLVDIAQDCNLFDVNSFLVVFIRLVLTLILYLSGHICKDKIASCRIGVDLKFNNKYTLRFKLLRSHEASLRTNTRNSTICDCMQINSAAVQFCTCSCVIVKLLKFVEMVPRIDTHHNLAKEDDNTLGER
uniref:Uncharacterized protein n=1 Tax=Onchocerca volvulus TaxID=6282 RepID=A0A8R1XYC2_ONCVO